VADAAVDLPIDLPRDAPNEPAADGGEGGALDAPSCACSGTTPICLAGGGCRACAAASECASGVCDVGIGATRGQCAAGSDIIYVDNVNGTCTAAGADGSAAHPYCQLTAAATALPILGRHYVKVAGSTASYDAVDFDTTPLTAAFTGPGRDATPPATILGGAQSALLLDPLSGSMNLTFDGFVFSQGAGNASAVECSGGNTAPTLVIRNAAIQNGRNGIHAAMCNAVVTETIIASASQAGAAFAAGSAWTLENDVIHHCAGGGLSAATQGIARFNTLAANGATNLAGGVVCSVPQLLEASIIATNTTSSGGSQFSGSCSLDHVVTGTDAIASPGKITSVPVFAGAFDFHLSVGTTADLAANRVCCIDQQPAAAQNPAIDFERDPRPRGAAFDLGADEAN
jgi:hypothetical protein